MIILQGLGVLFFWIALPVLVGVFVNSILKIEKSISSVYLVGMLVMWAAFQLLAVPLILLRSSILVLIAMWGILIAGLVALGWKYQRKQLEWRFVDVKAWKKRWGEKDTREKLSLCFVILVMCILVGQQCFTYLRGMHLDQDDARFVVNAVDAYERHTMLLTNPTTGEYLGGFVGDLNKDVAAPWSMYYAAVSIICRIYPTIMAHTIMPVFLLIMAYMAYWLLGKRLFGKDLINTALFVALIALLNTFFGPTVYTESVFLLTRIWQGKAVVAGVMLPILLWCMIELYHNYDKNGPYLLLAVANIATCLMSGMGIMLGAIFVCCFGLVYVICKRRLQMVWKLALICIPNIVYGLVYMLA